MNTQYTVWTASELKTGEVAVSGSVVGPLLSVGQEGLATTPEGRVKVLVVGIGVAGPNLGPPGRQGVLVKVLEGKVSFLNGAILSFTEKQR